MKCAVENIQFDCRHAGLLDWAPKVKELVDAGKLRLSGNYVCDAKVPLYASSASGQEVSCVGPLNKSCPHPKDAQNIIQL